jgi:hypothetical protein
LHERMPTRVPLINEVATLLPPQRSSASAPFAGPLPRVGLPRRHRYTRRRICDEDKFRTIVYGPPAPPLSRAIRRRTPEHQAAKVGRVANRKPFFPRRPRPVLRVCDIHRRAAPRSTRPAAFPHQPMSPSHAIPGQTSGRRASHAVALHPSTRGVHASYPPHHLPPRSRVL